MAPKKATKKPAAKKAPAKKTIAKKAAKKAPAKKAAPKKDKPKEKKPPGPYIVFCSIERPKLSDKLSFGEKGKKLGEMWGKLSDAAKAKYKK